MMDELTGGVAVRQSLNVEFAIVEERRADLVFLLENDTILHIDFQSENDGEMNYREGIYGLVIGKTHKRKIRQVVVYTGEKPMRMPDSLDTGDIQVRYRLLDIRELDCEKLMKSGRTGDLVLSLLAGGENRLVEILKRTKRLPDQQRNRVLSQLAALSGLRRLSGRLKMEVTRMGMYIDMTRTRFCARFAIRRRRKARSKARSRARLKSCSNY